MTPEAGEIRFTRLGRDPRVPRGRRMREPEPEPEAVDEPDSSSAYWSPEALFAESQRVEEELAEKPDLRTDAELLAELHLEETADGDAIRLAQRRLAKLHHPDRWATAPEAIAAEHEDAMRRINGVVATLRERGRC